MAAGGLRGGRLAPVRAPEVHGLEADDGQGWPFSTTSKSAAVSPRTASLPRITSTGISATVTAISADSAGGRAAPWRRPRHRPRAPARGWPATGRSIADGSGARRESWSHRLPFAVRGGGSGSGLSLMLRETAARAAPRAPQRGAPGRGRPVRPSRRTVSALVGDGTAPSGRLESEERDESSHL
jgi:hypothetical protein